MRKVVWLALAIGGCASLPSIGPAYKGVKLDVPETYKEAAGFKGEETLRPYWQEMDDPVLAELETRALRGNLSMAQAWQRVKQARAGQAMAFGEFGPKIGAQGGYEGQRIGAQANLVNGTTQTLDIFSAGLGASWELDIFGGSRRAYEAARYRGEAAQAAADGVRSMIQAEVARRYVAYRAYSQLVDLTVRQLEAAGTAAVLVQHQARVGLVDATVAAGAEARRQQLALQLPALKAAQASARYGLESLLGEKPGGLAEVLDTRNGMPLLPTSTTLVLPSDLIKLRPDLRARERAAAAATADVGVAMADLLPRFSLNGSYGVQGPTLGGLDEPTALVWSGGPSFRWTLLAMGQVWNNVKLRESRQKEAVQAYQQAWLDALADVETRLAAYHAAKEGLEAAAKLAEHNGRIAGAGRAQHARGLIDGARLQDMQIAGWQGEAAEVQARLQALTRFIDLQQAFGL